jgi:hypothetical protein
MALTQSSLSSKIETEIKGKFGNPDDATVLKKFCDAVAKAVVDEIKANAVVSTTGTVISGPGTGGNVSTTGTVS